MVLPATDAGWVSHAVIKLRVVTMKHVAVGFHAGGWTGLWPVASNFSIEKHCEPAGGQSGGITEAVNAAGNPVWSCERGLANGPGLGKAADGGFSDCSNGLEAEH